jgi:hypothetical protein
VATDITSLIELQGHAIKNQDLLIASGAISSRGSEGLSAVDEDVEAAVCRLAEKVFSRSLVLTSMYCHSHAVVH